MSQLSYEERCRAVHDRIRAGESLAPCQAHLAECEPCRDLAVIGPVLLTCEGAADSPCDFGALEAALAQKQGALERVRCWPTAARRGLLLGGAGCVLAGAWGLAPWGELPPARSGLTLAALAGLLGAGLWHSLRPLQQPPLATWKWLSLVALAVAFPLALALLPAALPGAADHAQGLGGVCFGFGCLLGLPVLSLGLLLDRAPRGAMLGSGALLFLAASGMLGGVTLDARCAAPGLAHRLVGHGTLAATFVALGLVVMSLRRRR